MLRSLERALKTLLSISRFHIVMIAIMGCFTFAWILTGHYLITIPLICGLDWFLVNLLNRVVDLKEDRINQIHGTDFVTAHRKGIVVIGFLLLGLSLALTAWFFPRLTLWRLGYHALGLAYNWPLLPGRRRLKAVYFWKNSASALGFLITLFAYPLAEHSGGWAPGICGASVAIAIAFFFVFELSYEIIYDLRDVPGDEAAGIPTYPVVHGATGAQHIIDSLIGGSIVLLVVGYAVGVIPWRLTIMVCAPLIQFVYYKLAVKRGITSRDCVVLTWLGVALLVIYHVWFILNLPGAELG